MKTPTLIGTIIFMLSLLITALAAVQLSFFFPKLLVSILNYFSSGFWVLLEVLV